MKERALARSALRYLAIILVLCFCLGGFSGCRSAEYETATVYALDTVIEIKIPKSEKSASLVSECEAIIRELDAVCSAYNDSSELYRLNQSSGEECTVSASLSDILATARRLSEKTGGAYDYTVGALVSLWAISDAAVPLPSDSDISDALKLVGYGRTDFDQGCFVTEEGVRIDLGGIAKGYLAELLVDRLTAAEVGHGVLSLGGNIAVFGEKPSGDSFRIGIKNPAGGTFGSLTVNNSSGSPAHYVSVSGTYERYKTVDGVRYHHIIDTKTGRPVNNGLLSVAVISENGAEADALSTALFVMGYDRAMTMYDSGELAFEAVFVFEDGRVLCTSGAGFSPS